MICTGCGKEYWQAPDGATGGSLCVECVDALFITEEQHDFNEALKGADKWRDPPIGTLDETAKRLLGFICAENERAWRAAAPGEPRMPFKSLSWEQADKDMLRATAKPIYERAQIAAQNRRLCDKIAGTLKLDEPKLDRGVSRLLTLFLRFLHWLAFGWRSKR